MKRISLLCFLSGLVFANVVFGASFNCSKASNKIEVMICSDAELSALDDNLSKIYKQVLNETDNKEYIKSEQMKWIKTRNNCNTIDCLKKYYEDRIFKLKNNKLDFEDNNTKKVEKKSLNNSKKYAGVTFGENINNYESYIHAHSFYDMRGTGVSYTYAGFVGHVISTKKDNIIDKISIEKRFYNEDEVNNLKNSFDSKYKFIDKMEQAKINVYDERYKEIIYSYYDENAVIKLIIDDYSFFSESYNAHVTLEYITKDLFNEIEAEKELRKTKEEERLNKHKKEAEGL
ncbi:lysozyme inhibitor LprI family protein [Aliarcobacter cryaerophilus]|uniref:Lysozyme inhibitor LprI family protein n=1 Tax=Arcobacter sp. AZ-2023 TaxID=3074453 RepID=A0AA96IGM4_9BACT|nr:lysozyme inhibitor LprI family protein [Arcobacter sp. AZ-2023]